MYKNMRRSKIVTAIKERVDSGAVTEPFTVASFPDVLKKSPAFLSKHRVDNPGGYHPYFVREETGKGEYRLLLDQ